MNAPVDKPKLEKFTVQFTTTTYSDFEVEAKDEDEALTIATERHKAGLKADRVVVDPDEPTVDEGWGEYQI